MPFSDFGLIPAHELRELTYGVTTPNSRKRGISLRGILQSGRTFGFTIYAAYSTLMVCQRVFRCSAWLIRLIL